MGLDGALRDEEMARDLPIRHPLRNQIDDLELGGGKALPSRCGSAFWPPGASAHAGAPQRSFSTTNESIRLQLLVTANSSLRKR